MKALVVIGKEYEVDLTGINPEAVNLVDFACDETKRMFADDLANNQIMAEDMHCEYLETVDAPPYFDKPTQLHIEERVAPCNDLVYYGAIGFQDKIICMDNGHIHPTSAIGDYLTIVERYDNWLNLSDETIGD